MRRFEMASKFWEIAVQGTSFTVRFGKLGTEGQTQKKSFGSPALAARAVDAIVAEKVGKGYREVGAKKAKTSPAKDAKSAPSKAKANAKTAPAKDAKSAPAKSAPTKANAKNTKTKASVPPAVAALCDGDLTELGTMPVDGKLFVGDPVLLPDGSVVKVTVPAGELRVAALERATAGKKRVHGLYAFREGAEVATLREVGTYGVDAGMGGFWTKAVEKAWTKLPDEPEHWLEQVIEPGLKGKLATVITLGAHRLAACNSGDGDGVYPVYVGKSAKGDVVAVLTVFVPVRAERARSEEAPPPEKNTEEKGRGPADDQMYFQAYVASFEREKKSQVPLGEIELGPGLMAGEVMAMLDAEYEQPLGDDVLEAAVPLVRRPAARYAVHRYENAKRKPIALVLLQPGATVAKWNGGQALLSISGVVGVWDAHAAGKVRAAGSEAARVTALREITLAQPSIDRGAIAPPMHALTIRVGRGATSCGVSLGKDAKGKHVGIALTIGSEERTVAARAAALAKSFVG